MCYLIWLEISFQVKLIFFQFSSIWSNTFRVVDLYDFEKDDKYMPLKY